MWWQVRHFETQGDIPTETLLFATKAGAVMCALQINNNTRFDTDERGLSPYADVVNIQTGEWIPWVDLVELEFDTLIQE